MAIGFFKGTDDLNNFVTSSLDQGEIVDYTVDILTKKHKEGPFYF
jgi:hypothetical protein